MRSTDRKLIEADGAITLSRPPKRRVIPNTDFTSICLQAINSYPTTPNNCSDSGMGFSLFARRY